MTQDQVKYIFECPELWGLRGDPFLWRELQSVFEREMPQDGETFKTMLHAQFRIITGYGIEPGERYFVEKYNLGGGGISAGRVSADFWLETGFPRLIERFHAVVD